MSENDQDEPQAPDAEQSIDSMDSLDSLDEGMKNLLKSALKEDEAPPPSVLEGFQRKVRARSGGKFYGEGWSTSREPPVSMFLITSMVMLAIVFAVYAVLGPLSGKPAPVSNEPAPINVLSPPQVGKKELIEKPAPAPSARPDGGAN